MMHMTLYWSRYVTLLVDSWKTDSYLSYVLTLLACFLFASFYQYMEDRRLRFKSFVTTTTSSNLSASTPLLKFYPVRRVRAGRIGSAILFGVNSAIGYILMLAIMSFNGGVFVAIVLGLGFGYGMFRYEDKEKEIVNVENPCACS